MGTLCRNADRLTCRLPPLKRTGSYNAAMLPSMPQRLLISLVCVLGAICWMGALPWLRPMDASTGITLGDAWPGVAEAVTALLVAGLPILLGAALVSALGTPLRGLFVVVVALSVVAAAGGGSQGYWWRHEDPVGYRPLIVETVAWAVGGLCWFWVIGQLALWLKKKLPHNSPPLAPRGPKSSLLSRSIQGLIASSIAAGVGGFLSNVMIQNTGAAQIVGSLILAFLIGAMVSQLIVPQSPPAFILVSPFLVAGIAYSIMLQQATDQTTTLFLSRLYAGHWPGMALALPIHYASAGVLGTSLGVGVAQSLDQVRHLDA